MRTPCGIGEVERPREVTSRGDVPPMIDERRENEAHLAYDLRPELQRVAGVGPF